MSTESLRLKPWFHYTDEEKSAVILNAYKKRVLKSEDLSSFINANRMHVWSQWLFPVFAAPLLNQFCWKLASQKLVGMRPQGYFGAFKIITLGASWLAWLNFSPLYKNLENQKEELLDTIEGRIGLNVKTLNQVLPRYWTSQEVNRQTVELYNQRNSIFAGYLYPLEENQEPLVDFESWPKNKSLTKIQK